MVKGTSDIICGGDDGLYGCLNNISSVSGEMSDREYDDGRHFTPSSRWECPKCGEQEEFWWAEFYPEKEGEDG